MKYKKIIKELAFKEKVSEKEIELEMENAIKLANLNCSVEEFIKMASKQVLKGLYIA